MDNGQPMRYAVYARYASDLQRQTSIADQIRKCHEFGQEGAGRHTITFG